MMADDYTANGDRGSDEQISIPESLYKSLENYAEDRGVSAREVLIGIILAWTDV